jgi:hypothetical protein
MLLRLELRENALLSSLSVLDSRLGKTTTATGRSCVSGAYSAGEGRL